MKSISIELKCTQKQKPMMLLQTRLTGCPLYKLGMMNKERVTFPAFLKSMHSLNNFQIQVVRAAGLTKVH